MGKSKIDHLKIVEFVRKNTLRGKKLNQHVLWQYLKDEFDIKRPSFVVANLLKYKILDTIKINRNCVFLIIHKDFK